MIALRHFLHFVLRILMFSLLLAGIHYLLATNTAITPPVEEVFRMHVFIVLLTAAGYGVVTLVGYRDHNKVGFTFLGLVIVKIIVSFAFLYPYLKSPDMDVPRLVINFFAVYFLFLGFEVREVYLLIQKGATLSK